MLLREQAPKKSRLHFVEVGGVDVKEGGDVVAIRNTVVLEVGSLLVGVAVMSLLGIVISVTVLLLSRDAILTPDIQHYTFDRRARKVRCRCI